MSFYKKIDKLKKFVMVKMILQKYPITEYQPVYFVADSFESAKLKLREFCKLIPRPFAVRYNPYTESVEVIDKKEKLLQVASDMQGKFHVQNLLIVSFFFYSCVVTSLRYPVYLFHHQDDTGSYHRKKTSRVLVPQQW